jgi:hypothetical protein
MATVDGTVVSGRGICGTVIAEHNQEIENIVGAALYPGSLNVVLARPLRLDETTASKFDHDERLLWPASIDGFEIWLYRWRNAPLLVLEVVAPSHLRTMLGINTGSTVRISIPDRFIKRVAVVSRLVWAAAYAGRLDWYYSHDGYSNKIHGLCVDLGATQVEYSGTPTAVWTIAKKAGKKLPLLQRAVGAGRRLYGRNENNEYCFDRPSIQNELAGRPRSLASIYTLLSYTKISNSEYSAIQYPAAYHSIEIEGEVIRGQRNPLERLSKVPFDFSGKSVLDIGSNQGGMVINIGDKLKWGIGIDGDSRLVNVANRIAWAKGEDNLRFFTFDLEKEPLNLIQDFLPEEEADICFLLSVCMWLTNWRSVMDAAQLLAPRMLFESNGTEVQQAEQEAYLRTKYRKISLVSARSDDDPRQKKRQLFLAEGRA